MEKQLITVSAEINVPIKTAWEIRTQPNHIVKWNFASDDWHSPNAVNDLKVGGKFVYTMAAKDGSFSFDFSGTYTLVEENKRFDYTMDDGRKSTVTFEDKDGRTLISETFEAENMNPVEMQKTGWQSILNNLKKYAENTNTI